MSLIFHNLCIILSAPREDRHPSSIIAIICNTTSPANHESRFRLIHVSILYICYTWNHETYNTCDWLLSHSTTFSRFIRVIEGVAPSFFSMAPHSPVAWLYHFVHLIMGGGLHCFLCWVIVNKGAMNICVRWLEWTELCIMAAKLQNHMVTLHFRDV